MIVSAVPMMMVPECHHANQVDGKPETADNEEFAKSLGLGTLPQSFERLKGDFNAQEPNVFLLLAVFDLFQNTQFPRLAHINRMPLANPDKVSILPNP